MSQKPLNLFDEFCYADVHWSSAVFEKMCATTQKNLLKSLVSWILKKMQKTFKNVHIVSQAI